MERGQGRGCDGVSPKMGKVEYFRVGPGSNGVDVRVEEDQASCCGVNLAFAGFGGCGLFFGLV